MENKYFDIIKDFFEFSEFVLIDLKQRGDSKNIVIEIFVDKKLNFSIDELAVINRELWKYIEDIKLEKNISKIIVSSPGAETPFKHFWQMAKHLGREIEFKIKTGEIVSGKFVEITDEEKGDFILQIKEKKDIKSLKYNFYDLQDIKVKLSFKK